MFGARSNMAIGIRCECGRAMSVKEELAGREIRCPTCKTAMLVPGLREPVPDEVEVEVLDQDTIKSGPPPARRKKSGVDDECEDELPSIRKKRKRRRRRSEESGWSMPELPRIAVSPTIWMGLAMMVGAVVWFFTALALGWIFFYPPVMFVLGALAVFRGLAGQED
jgi:hypothetical protein